MTTDSKKLEQIFTNLMSNSLKFTETGEINAFLDFINGALQLKVQDTGIGIQAAQIERIFDGFFQGTTSSESMHGGNGLGLTISKHYVKMIGGTISVASEVGKGSTFTVLLPINHFQVAREK